MSKGDHIIYFLNQDTFEVTKGIINKYARMTDVNLGLLEQSGIAMA